MTAGEVLAGEEAPPGDAVVVLGGEMIGVEVAAYLAQRGKIVSITRRGEKLAENMGRTMRRVFLDYLRENGAGIHTGVTYRKITGEGLLILDEEGREVLLPADLIVIAAGLVPEESAERVVEGAGLEVFRVGDCSKPRNIRWAVHEGFEAGFEI
ncbi:MAG: NAD(P)/FAD-dependent oxidoreductase [Actinobacteria bacterium]|nr:NAD(P)/FAD-dependent oxidoreductase [Actinomycetota bacterium]MBU4219944.1 NAD(P)/FAD-dependent oxidoreductase [Actinomycetota bacterium]MBU4358290.1 NAD(P)/FAD-dependent oxidoreductase [Actinomycetota bacterium]MBU4392829.1 NAD(P)/FAD-dependent oxidoreductase [Actinomycetota bacterium]MBU4403537.1 NAD(P)/FAD-dependent oxidoreductase [Actinomycetota bacterium]